MLILQPQVRGFMKLEAINKFSGKRRVLADWFPNKVLNTGLNRMGTTSDWLNCAQVGTNSTTPSAGDTGLLGYVAGSNDIRSNTFSAQGTAPYYGFRRKTYRFAAGTVAANLSEAGVGWSTAEGAYLYCRALIVDTQGNPTTVTPLADELLELFYELRYYPPLSDVIGTMDFGGVTYDTIVRAAEVTNATWWGSIIGNQVQHWFSSGDYWQAYDGTLGTIEQSPNGTSASGGSGANVSSSAYSNNSLQRDMNFSTDINGCNLAGGIRSFRFTTYGGRYQAQFSSQVGGNTIPKDALTLFGLGVRVSWAEGVAA